MARIRSIKPDIWEDEALAEVSTSARLLFIGLITQADDDGRLPGRSQWIARKVYPYDYEITPSDIEGWIDELDRVKLIQYYEVEGKPYISLPSWDRHQSIDKRWRKESKFPPPPQEATARPRRDHGETSRDVQPNDEENSPPDRIGGDRRGGDRKETAPADADAGKPAALSGAKLKVEFDVWLAHYHEVTGRTSVTGSKTAKSSFKARRQEGKTVEQLKLATVGCHSDPWRREKGHDIPETILRVSNVEGYISQGLRQNGRPASGSAGIEQAHRFAEMAREAEAEEARAVA